MSRTIWLVATRCTDPAREEEFNRWYDEVHIPDALAVPHIVAARRFRLARDASPTASPWAAEDGPRYLAIYELDTDDPAAVLRTVSDEVMPRLRAAGRWMECVAVHGSTFFAPLGPRREAAG